MVIMHLPAGILAIGYPYRVVVGFGLCALGGALLFTYFRTNLPETDKSSANASRRRSKLKTKQSSSSKKPSMISSQERRSLTSNEKDPEICIEFAIANEHIPLVVGRGGSNLKSIEDRTQTNIHFRDKDDHSQWCEVKGQSDQVYEAEQLLLRETERIPNCSEELYVPQSVYGEIAGRCGEAMQEICRLSLAKLAVDVGDQGGQMRRIIISGNRQQVNIARKLIDDKIEEDLLLKRDLAEAEQRREPRRSMNSNNSNNSNSSSQNSLNVVVAAAVMPTREKLCVCIGEGGETAGGGDVSEQQVNMKNVSMKVYVSAVESPSKFWVQLLGNQIKRLDDLVEVMSEYYDKVENRLLHQIQVPYLGQIVATVLKSDNKWYRAEVARILPNEYNPNDVVLDLYFVDYGDRQYVLPKEIFELRTDFLTLRFQAIECFLANVQSMTENYPENWDAQAIAHFEQLVQVARWKQLTARVVTYKERFKANSTTTTNAEKIVGSREASPIPGVELFDIQNEMEVNLNELMVKNGYAMNAVKTLVANKNECEDSSANISRLQHINGHLASLP